MLAVQSGPKSRENGRADDILRPMPFGVPLYTENKVRARQAHRFNLAVRGRGLDAKAGSQAVDALAMQRVNLELC